VQTTHSIGDDLWSPLATPLVHIT